MDQELVQNSFNYWVERVKQENIQAYSHPQHTELLRLAIQEKMGLLAGQVTPLPINFDVMKQRALQLGVPASDFLCMFLGFLCQDCDRYQIYLVLSKLKAKEEGLSEITLETFYRWNYQGVLSKDSAMVLWDSQIINGENLVDLAQF